MIDEIDFEAEAFALVISEFREDERFTDWLISYVQEVKETDDATVAAANDVFSLETAEGVHLDLLGRLLREPRSSRDDDDYRRALRVRVLVNRSRGTIPDLARIADVFSFTGEDDRNVYAQSSGTKYIEVIVTDTSEDIDPNDLYKYLNQARPAATSLTVRAPWVGGDSAFRFCLQADYSTGPDARALGFRWTGEGGPPWTIGAPLLSARNNNG